MSQRIPGNSHAVDFRTKRADSETNTSLLGGRTLGIGILLLQLEVGVRKADELYDLDALDIGANNVAGVDVCLLLQ